MAIRFSEEKSVGFTISEWNGFNVTVVEVSPELQTKKKQN